jgi:carboxymethylenebutenolidase
MCHERLTAPISGGAGIDEEEITFSGKGEAIPAFFARPEGVKAPAVLIIHDVWGAPDFYHDLARRFAVEGFATLLPDFFVREGPPANPSREAVMARRARHSQVTAVADIAAAIRWLQNNKNTTGKVGTVGFCMGGTLAMLAAGRDPLPDATVVFYGFPAPQATEKAPLLPINEVERVRSPILGFWGEEDKGVGMDNVKRYDEALKRAGAFHEFTIFPIVGHGFLTFKPDAPAFEASQEAFQKTVAFLRDKLAP